MRALTALSGGDMPALYQLMVAEDFPDVPETFGEAKPLLDDVLAYGLFDKGGLKAAFVFGDITETSAFMDVVCLADWRGRWATQGIVRQVLDIGFHRLGLDFVWVQPRNSVSLRAALKAGFVYATPPDRVDPVLILTKRNMRNKFKFVK